MTLEGDDDTSAAPAVPAMPPTDERELVREVELLPDGRRITYYRLMAP